MTKEEKVLISPSGERAVVQICVYEVKVESLTCEEGKSSSSLFGSRA